MSSNDQDDTNPSGPANQPSDRTMPAMGKDPGASKALASGVGRPDGSPPAGGAKSGPPDPLLGQSLGGCRIDGLLGRGAMGAVYRAKQLSLDREVAIKVIRPELLTDPRILKRFEVEARTVGRFNSPHVVMVHDVGFEHGVHFLVMEFVKGKNLRDHTKVLAGGRLPVVEALPLLRQACKGLEEAQRLGVLHRDIKPDNLMLTDRGVLKIADFGIAKPTQEDFSMTMTSELIGTPLYMSPEQCQASADLDFRSDMYSLGATFYYLLTGEPPIRASSVYELIQTKTKLENLCLWKALPELDENHPLSRVIERMTALSRDDRYPSYEALVSDLALVEQGRTLEIQRPKSKVQTPVVAPPKPRGPGLLIGALVLVVALAGGGYAWLQTQKAGSTTPGLSVAKRLEILRQRLAETGPSPGLRSEVAGVVPEPPQQADHQRLLADVDQGLELKARLAAVPKPKELELPFTDLRNHWLDLSRAALTTGAPGQELQHWLAGAVVTARAEPELSAMANAKLVSTFAAWQAERPKVGTDLAQLADMGRRLDTIEEGRRNLIALLPKLADGLAKDVSYAALAAARQGLASTGAAPVTVDISVAITEIRAEFASQGPIASIVDRCQELRPNVPAQVEERGRLLDELQKASGALELARGVRASLPAEPQLPFDDVATYYAAIDRELQPLARPDTGLPSWAAKEREELRDGVALQQKVLQRCRSSWADWQQRRGIAATAAAELTALEVDLGKLRAGIQRGKELFPAAVAEFDGIVTAAVVAEAQTGLGSAAKRLQWLGGMRELARRLEALTGIADYRAARVQAEQEFATQRTAAADFATALDVTVELQRTQAILDRWREAEARVAGLGKAIGSGDLPAADQSVRAGLTGSEGRDEFRAFEQSASRAIEAMQLLDKELDVARALALLGEARTALKVFGGLERSAGDRLDQWTRAVQSLQSAAVGMLPIAGGRTKTSSQPVAAFFLGRTEVRQQDYVKFLEELHTQVVAAGARDAAAMQKALEPRLGALVPSAELLQSMLDRRTKLRSPELPVESVCWWEAAAYAEWFRLSLPTDAEWALAAFGDGNRSVYPWGNDWKDDDASRNIGNAAVAADAGGKSWRSTERVTLHHLAGNVAEWLAGSPTATEGLLAGGRYNDTRKEARVRAAGEEFHKSALTRALPGFGFRTLLRPQQFLAKDFAGGKFPVLGR